MAQPRADRQRPPFAWVQSVAWAVVVAAVILVPCVVSASTHDAMRLPKVLLFRAAMIAAGAILVVALAATSGVVRIRTVPAVAAVIVLWTAVTTLASTNRIVSERTLAWVIGCAIFACAVDWAGRHRNVRAIAWVVIPGCVNALIFLAQRFHIWNPMRFDSDVPEHFRYTALLGNPDDVGSFLVAPGIVAFAFMLVDRSRRWLWAPPALLILAAIATGTLTPIGACGAGLIALAGLASRRTGIAIAIGTVIAILAVAIGYAPLRTRLGHVVTSLKNRDYAEAVSGRVTPFLAAAQMARDHPLTGVGPGCFAWGYAPYKERVEARYPALRRAFVATFSFGEVHNDHLQFAAETGILGYLLFASCLVLVATVSFRTTEPVAHIVALPLVIAYAVLALAHFPLHLAASTSTSLFLAAVLVGTSPLAELPARYELRLTRETSPALVGIAAVVATAAAVWIMVIACLRPYRCDIALKSTEEPTRIAFERGDRYYSAAIARANLELLAPCLAHRPNAAVLMIAAGNERVLGRLAEAAALYRRALTTDRRPEISYNLGIVELQLGDRRAALHDLLDAVRFSPTYLEGLPDDVRLELERSAAEK